MLILVLQCFQILILFSTAMYSFLHMTSRREPDTMAPLIACFCTSLFKSCALEMSTPIRSLVRCCTLEVSWICVRHYFVFSFDTSILTLFAVLMNWDNRLWKSSSLLAIRTASSAYQIMFTSLRPILYTFMTFTLSLGLYP